MINVLIIFLTLIICIIFAIGSFVVGVKSCVKDKGEDTMLTSEEAEKLEDALYLVALSCKTELQVIY